MSSKHDLVTLKTKKLQHVCTHMTLTKTVAELRPWEGTNLKVGRVEIL